MKFREITWHDARDWEDNPRMRFRVYTFPGMIGGVSTAVRAREVWVKLGEGRSGWMCEQAVTSALRHIRCTRRRFPYIHPDSRVEACEQADFTEVWTLADEAPDALPVD